MILATVPTALDGIICYHTVPFFVIFTNMAAIFIPLT